AYPDFFAYSEALPSVFLGLRNVSQLVQTASTIARRDSAQPFSGISWQLGLLALLTLWLYWSTLAHLVGQWWQAPNFSPCFFFPLFSAFVLWQEREHFSRLPVRPSWSGLPILVLGMF